MFAIRETDEYQGALQVRRYGGVIETSPWGVVNTEQSGVKNGGHAIGRYSQRPHAENIDESLALVAG